jgi:hypothetical protein
MAISPTRTDLALLDTNVVVYAHAGQSPYHLAAKALLQEANEPQAGLCVAPQTVAEFFAVVTSPKRVTSPQSPEEALLAIEQLLARPGITLLPVPPDVVHRWIELAHRYPVTQQRIFDLQLVATMFGNGVHRLYTFNRADFERFADIEVLTPHGM